jgi:hypothetical protein
MTGLVDLVNFNADASCLPAADWLAALRHGDNSTMCRWLRLYVEYSRRVVIGFTGATIADMAELNPEAIAVVKAHPDIFEAVLRPFSHDVALLRSPSGFAWNAAAGRAAIEREFTNVSPYFLPAEFMLTNAQVWQLARSGVRGTFVNAARYPSELRPRIPGKPYLVRGIFGSTLRCMPVHGALHDAYLRALHLWDVTVWNHALGEIGERVSFSWRDGESFLFLPDGIERERAWLKGESGDVERMFLSHAERGLDIGEPDLSDTRTYRSYPVHSFSDWIKEFRMLGYLGRLNALEQRLDKFDAIAKALWLMAINSDVFSAVEKESPVVTLRRAPAETGDTREIEWTMLRSERGVEGEEFLELLEAHLSGGPALTADTLRQAPHIRKLRARQSYLERLAGLHG